MFLRMLFSKKYYFKRQFTFDNIQIIFYLISPPKNLPENSQEFRVLQGVYSLERARFFREIKGS